MSDSPPQIPTISSLANPSVTGWGPNGELVFLFNAAPNPGDLLNDAWLDAHLIGSAVVGPDGQWSIDPDPPLTQGTTTLHAVSFDDDTGLFSAVASQSVNYVIAASGGPDNFTGTNGSDTFDGLGGDDLIDGGDGNDILDGGDGVDFIEGGNGHDRIDGGNHDDDLFGEAGNDVIRGGSGNDTLDGGFDHDRLFGEDGDDELFGRDGNDYLIGGIGHDTMTGDAGDDHMEGGSGNDVMSGGSGNDLMLGGSGNDFIDGGENRDHMEGGTGNDTYIVDFVHDLVVEQAGEGNDTVEAHVNVSNLSENVENLILEGAVYLGVGNDGHNTITGNDFANKLQGRNGNDLLLGLDGNDTLLGGIGNDILVGGLGNDIVTGGAGNDIFRFGPGDGADIVTDFKKGQDKIDLDGFPGLTDVEIGPGPGPLPDDGSPTVLYSNTTGKLWYDADGDGAGARILLATIMTKPNLAAGDFI